MSGIDCCFVVQDIVITSNYDSRSGITFAPTHDGSGSSFVKSSRNIQVQPQRLSETMEKQIVKLKDGREVILRLLDSRDKEQILRMFANMSDDALLWSNPPYDDVKIDRWMSGTKSGLSLVAIFEDDLVGISAVYQFPKIREKGVGEMMIYIHQDFHRVGLGTIMTETLLALAKDKRMHRIGLEVVEDNEAAVRLYKKVGFEIEGTMRDAYYGADGKYHNALVMGILFPED